MLVSVKVSSDGGAEGAPKPDSHGRLPVRATLARRGQGGKTMDLGLLARRERAEREAWHAQCLGRAMAAAKREREAGGTMEAEVLWRLELTDSRTGKTSYLLLKAATAEDALRQAGERAPSCAARVSIGDAVAMLTHGATAWIAGEQWAMAWDAATPWLRRHWRWPAKGPAGRRWWQNPAYRAAGFTSMRVWRMCGRPAPRLRNGK